MDSTEKEELRRLIISKAVERREAGFVLASGIKSRLYVDLRRITQDPRGINLIAEIALSKIQSLSRRIDAVGGLETGSIPIATAVCMLSANRNNPIAAFWVRKSVKDHGMQNLIEGALKKGMNTVILEDTATTGSSSLKAARAVEDFGARVVETMSIVDRGAAKNFQKAHMRYSYIFSEADLE